MSATPKTTFKSHDLTNFVPSSDPKTNHRKLITRSQKCPALASDISISIEDLNPSLGFQFHCVSLKDLKVSSSMSFSKARNPYFSQTLTKSRLASNPKISLPTIPLKKPVDPFEDDQKEFWSTERNPFTNLFFSVNRLTFEQNKEECEVRYNVIQKKLKELDEMMTIDERARTLYHKSQINEYASQIFEVVEPILTMMGIQVRPYVKVTQDSGLTIQPLLDRYKLASFCRVFVPELCRFNYTFLAKLKIGAITVCESLKLTNDTYHNVLKQKLHNGLFIQEKMTDARSIQQHWFKVVLYHFLKIMPEFFGEWKALVERSNNKPKGTKPFEELLGTLNCVMGVCKKDWNEDLQMRERVKFLIKALKSLDPLAETKSLTQL